MCVSFLPPHSSLYSQPPIYQLKSFRLWFGATRRSLIWGGGVLRAQGAAGGFWPERARGRGCFRGSSECYACHHDGPCAAAQKDKDQEKTLLYLDDLADFVGGAGAVFSASMPGAQIDPVVYNGKTKKDKWRTFILSILGQL